MLYIYSDKNQKLKRIFYLILVLLKVFPISNKILRYTQNINIFAIYKIFHQNLL